MPESTSTPATHLVDRIGPAVRRSMRREVLRDSGIRRAGRVPLDRYRRPVLVSGTDGSARSALAIDTGRHDTVASTGRDVRQRCPGPGRPSRVFSSTISRPGSRRDVAARVIEGIVEGCVRAAARWSAARPPICRGLYTAGTTISRALRRHRGEGRHHRRRQHARRRRRAGAAFFGPALNGSRCTQDIAGERRPTRVRRGGSRADLPSHGAHVHLGQAILGLIRPCRSAASPTSRAADWSTAFPGLSPRDSRSSWSAAVATRGRVRLVQRRDASPTRRCTGCSIAASG